MQVTVQQGRSEMAGTVDNEATRLGMLSDGRETMAGLGKNAGNCVTVMSPSLS